MSSKSRQISNHYDGLRVDIDSVLRFDDDTDADAIEAFRAAGKQDVLEKTGYTVRIAVNSIRLSSNCSTRSSVPTAWTLPHMTWQQSIGCSRKASA